MDQHRIGIAAFLAGGFIARAGIEISEACLRVDLVRAKATIGQQAIDHRIAERFNVAGRFPNGRMNDDGGIDADDIFAFLGHPAPPGLLEVAFEFHAEGTVIPETVDAAVDLRGLENEPPPLTERDDLFHALACFQFSHTKAEKCYG